jgi:hypothetical protein
MDKMDVRPFRNCGAPTASSLPIHSGFVSSHLGHNQELYSPMNISQKPHADEYEAYNILFQLDDISGKSYSEAMFDTYGSFGLLVWLKVKTFDAFNKITMPDELLLELVLGLLNGLKDPKGASNTLAKLVQVLPDREVLFKYLEVSTPMEAALILLCITIHKEYAKTYLNSSDLSEFEFLLCELQRRNSTPILNQALRLCGFTSLLKV